MVDRTEKLVYNLRKAHSFDSEVFSFNIMDVHPIFDAIQNGTEETVRKMLAAGVDLNLHDDSGDTMLFCAALAGRPEMIRILLEAGADPNAGPEDEYRTNVLPLHAAALSGNCEIIRLLLAAGADVNRKDFLGGTPLFLTTWYGQFEAAQLLLEAGAEELPFNDAAEHGFLPILELFLRHESVTEDVWETFGFSALHKMVIRNQPSQTERLIREELAARDRWGYTPLHWAAGLGRMECLNLLWEAGADLEAAGPREFRALNLAVQNIQREAVRFLIDAGAKLDFEPSPISGAIVAGDLTILKALLDAGADPNFRLEKNHQPPLTIAAEENDLDAAKLLIQYGADVNPKTPMNLTPFFEAVCTSSPKMAKLLLESGLDPNTTDEDGQTLLETAMKFINTEEIVQMLKDAGAK